MVFSSKNLRLRSEGSAPAKIPYHSGVSAWSTVTGCYWRPLFSRHFRLWPSLSAAHLVILIFGRNSASQILLLLFVGPVNLNVHEWRIWLSPPCKLLIRLMVPSTVLPLDYQHDINICRIRQTLSNRGHNWKFNDKHGRVPSWYVCLR